MRKSIIFFLLLLLLPNFSCNKNVDKDTLTGTWALHQYKNLLTGITGHEPDGIPQKVEITFLDDGESGTFTGHTIEHDFSGSYNILDDRKLEIFEFEQAGADENNWGKKFVWAMDRINRFKIRNQNNMEIFFSGETEKMKFKRVED